MLTVSELYIYPLKSAQCLSLDEIIFTERGPLFDRDWMIVNKNNRFITQRQHPKMCLINVEIENGALTLTAPSMASLSIKPESSTQKISVTVWNDSVNALDCGEAAAQWVSDYLRLEQCRLVTMPKNTQRYVDKTYAKQNQTVSFADGFPSLIISQASLDDFNEKLDSPISMTNFRPNIVISGCEPYAEDHWTQLRIDGINFSLIKPCSRCVIPSINQETAEKQAEVLPALNQHRRRDKATYFGQNALHDKIGTIKVGSVVEVISR